MGTPLESLTIHGFKSIEKLENFAVDKKLTVLEPPSHFDVIKYNMQQL